MSTWGTLCAKSSALWHGQHWKKTSKSLQERKSQAAQADTCLALHMRSCPKTCSQKGRTRILCSRLGCSNLLLVPIPELQQFIPSSILPVLPSPPAGASNWWWQHHTALTAPKPHHAGTIIMGQNTPSQSPAPATPPGKQLSRHNDITASLS